MRTSWMSFGCISYLLKTHRKFAMVFILLLAEVVNLRILPNFVK